jgi:hypothetical protein
MQPKALRIAAYFLIAHYALVTGLGLMGSAPPDYVRMLVTLAFLIAAVLVLFKPKRRGWLMAIGYSLYMLSPFLGAAWAMWSMPGLDSTAKVAALVVILVVNVPLIVALVLVFKPTSFAAFRNPPVADAAATAAKP